MTELYKWCPNCHMEEIVNEEEPRTVYGGSDGYGQPVRYSECECGKAYGWFNMMYYRSKGGFIFDDSFKRYLKQRIKHYYRE